MRAAIVLALVVVCCWETVRALDQVPNADTDLEFSNITPGIEYATPLSTPQEESSGEEDVEEASTVVDSSEGDDEDASSTAAPPAQGGDDTHPPYFPSWHSKKRCNKTNTAQAADWHWKFENLTREQKQELMHKHHAFYANLTEEVLGFVNITYHQMMQLPPRGDEANASLCVQRAKLVKHFLYTLHQMVKPFMRGGHGWKGRGERGSSEKRGGYAERGNTWPRPAGHGDDDLSGQIKVAIEDAISDLLRDRRFQTNVQRMVSASLLGQQTNSTLQAPNHKGGWGLGGWGQDSNGFRGRGQSGQNYGGRGQGGQGHGGRDQGGQSHAGLGQGGQGQGGRGQGGQGHGGRDQGGQSHAGLGQGGQGQGGRGQGGQGHAGRDQNGRGQNVQGLGDRRQRSSNRE